MEEAIKVIKTQDPLEDFLHKLRKATKENFEDVLLTGV